MINFIVSVFLIFNTFLTFSQIHSGTIVFERKTNLKKMYGKYLPPKWNNHVKFPKVDQFSLFFNDSICLFTPIETKEVDILEWALNYNTLYTNRIKHEKKAVLSFYDEKYLIDSLTSKKGDWKITQEIREIAGFTCIKSFKIVNGLKLYAWFCPYINPDFGPEGLEGLPGMILGIALEDGSITYFAIKVDTDNHTEISLTETDKMIRKRMVTDFQEHFNNTEIPELARILLKDLIKWL